MISCLKINCPFKEKKIPSVRRWEFVFHYFACVSHDLDHISESVV